VEVSAHVEDRLPLEAADALAPEEAGRVRSHLRVCPPCAARAAEWRSLCRDLHELPPGSARPSAELLARTRRAVEWSLTERADSASKGTLVALLLAFGWTLIGASWLVFNLFARMTSLRSGVLFDWPPAGFAAYLAAGWVMAVVAGVLLGSRARAQGRTI
jgi:anti-sigma factor RsiW